MNTQSTLSATIICLTKNIMNIPSHFCFCYTKACVCYHDGAWMPCIGPHVLVANILMHGSSRLGIYGLSFLWTQPFLHFWQPTSTERSDCQYTVIKQLFFVLLTILVTDLKVNSGGYILYCFAAWWINPPVSLTLTEVNKFFSTCIYHTDTKKLVYFFQYTKNWSEIKLLTCDFVSLAAWRWIELGIHFGTSQSAHPKSTIYLFGVY